MPKVRTYTSSPIISVLVVILAITGFVFEQYIRNHDQSTLVYKLSADDGQEFVETIEVDITTLSTDPLYELLALNDGTILDMEHLNALDAFQVAGAQDQKLMISYLGHALSSRNRFNEALNFLDELTPEERILFGSSFAYAETLKGLDRTDEALAAYDVHTKANPHHQASHINYAILLAKADMHLEAIDILQHTIGITGSSRKGKAYSLLGISNFELGNYAHAVEAYQKSIEFRPTHGPTWRRLATARGYLSTSTPSEVIETFVRANAIAPDNARTQHAWANYYFSVGRFDEALKHYREATELSSGRFNILFDRALNLYASERPSAANKVARALRDEKRSEGELQQIAVLEAILDGSEERIETALADWSSAADTDRDRYLTFLATLERGDLRTATQLSTYFMEGSAYSQPIAFALARHAYQQEDYQSATEQLMVLIEASPDSPAYALYLARSLNALDDTDGAYQAYQAAYELHPESRKISVEYSEALRTLEKRDEAIQILLTYLEKKPKDTSALLALGEAYEENEAYQEAEQTYRSVFSLEASDIEVGAKLAATQMRAGSLSSALVTVNDLIETEPAKTDIRLLRIEILQRQGETEAAGEEAQRILKLDPENPVAQAMLKSIPG